MLARLPPRRGRVGLNPTTARRAREPREVAQPKPMGGPPAASGPPRPDGGGEAGCRTRSELLGALLHHGLGVVLALAHTAVLGLLHLLVDEALEGRQRLGAAQEAAVDEERR